MRRGFGQDRYPSTSEYFGGGVTRARTIAASDTDLKWTGAQERAADSSKTSNTSAQVREQTAPLTSKGNSRGFPDPTPPISKSPAAAESDPPSGADSISSHPALALRAELRDSDTAAGFGITVTCNAPVLNLCRRLIEAGYPLETPMDVYRGETLALRVRTIGEAARLVVKSAGNGAPVFAVESRKVQ